MADHPDHPDHPDDIDRGLAFDLRTLSRRRVLQAFGAAGVGALALVACGSDSSPSPAAGATATGSAAPGSTTSTSGTSASTATVAPSDTTRAAGGVAAASEEIPDETGGPYPGDGTNGVNVLTEDGIVRSDITSSFGAASGVADGIPLTVVLGVQDMASGGNPMTGAAVYAWHCDAAGRYSLYSQGATDENYLRGVQEVGADGTVTFHTIVPGCYAGRWPHLHFEVYESVDAASNGRNALKTSQLAITQAICEAAYADARYPQSASNLARVSLATDNVFGDDGAVLQLPIFSGSNDTGYTAVLPVGV